MKNTAIIIDPIILGPHQINIKYVIAPLVMVINEDHMMHAVTEWCWDEIPHCHLSSIIIFFLYTLCS